MTEAEMRANGLKARLARGGCAFGTWIVLSRNPAIVRIAAAAGFEFVFIDTEHSDFDWQTVATMCDIARASGIVPVVRPYDTNPHLANRLQDLGAMGLMYHDVTSRDQVDSILPAMHYPPDGTRGLTSFGASVDYVQHDPRILGDYARDTTMLVVQIESAAGVTEIDSILAGGGVDLVEVGRGDLSMSLGVPMQPKHERVNQAIAHVVERATAHGVAVGVNCVSVNDGKEMLDLGVRCISYSSDRRILQSAYADACEKLAGHAVEIPAAAPIPISSGSKRISR